MCVFRLPAIGIHPKPMSNFYPEDQLSTGEDSVEIPAAFVERTGLDVRISLDTEQGHRSRVGGELKEEDDLDRKLDTASRSSHAAKAKSEEDLFTCRMRPAEQSPRYKTPPALTEVSSTSWLVRVGVVGVVGRIIKKGGSRDRMLKTSPR